jgi:DNA-binding CsgD family transcriptional regulator/tetratricopeptide (TPR) repeat protein
VLASSRDLDESVGVGTFVDELVGREAELERLDALVRQLGAGRSSTLVVEGEAGIGKTSLIGRLIALARSSGAATFCAGAHPFDRTRPFGVIATALGLSRRSSDPRRAALAALMAGKVPDGSPPAGGDTQFQIVEEIVDLVETACAERPVLLVAEDVHWADNASLMTISALARALPLSALLIVATTRPTTHSPEATRLLDELSAGGSRTLELTRLSRAEVAALAELRLGAPPGPQLSALLVRAGGNPLWAEAMLRSLADEGMLEDAGDLIEATSNELPESLNDLVVRRLRHLSPETRELLRIAAVLGDAVSLRDVAAVAARRPAEVVRGLGEAYEAHLLDEADERVVFRHQLVHDAIYQHVPASSRRLLHREAATALMAAGVDRLEVANHLILGAERGDDAAVELLREASRDASVRAPAVAVELVRRAEALLPAGHPSADHVSTEVVQALMQAGRVAEATERAGAVLARKHAVEVDLPLRLCLLSGLALQNRATEVISLANSTLSGPVPLQPTERVLVLAQQSWALTYSGAPVAGERAAGEALDTADATGHAALSVWALTALLVAEGRQGRFDDALTHARRAAALADRADVAGTLPIQPKVFLGLALFDCDLVDEARAAYRDALGDEFGTRWWLSETLVADARASFVIGEWDDALPRLIASAEAAREKDHSLLESQSLAYQAIIATASGDLTTASGLAGRIVGSVEGEQLSYNAGIIASAVAGVREAQGDRSGALGVLVRCWRDDVAKDNRYYHRCLAPDLVRLALALGDRDLACEVAATVSAGSALALDVPTVRSVALRCQGMVDADPDALLEAVAQARRTPLLIEITGACEDAAAVLVGHGRGDEAAALLSEVLERFERSGARGWAGRVRGKLRELGVRPGQRGGRDRPAHGWDSLTPMERTVSLLVAEGLTNGAVARRLYMSPHTVNTHLRHVFAKLGISNRVALAGIVHRSIE